MVMVMVAVVEALLALLVCAVCAVSFLVLSIVNYDTNLLLGYNVDFIEWFMMILQVVIFLTITIITVFIG